MHYLLLHKDPHKPIYKNSDWMINAPMKLKIPPAEFIDISQSNVNSKGEKIYKNSDIPSLVTLDWICKYLEISPHTLGDYRKVAYKFVDKYRKSVTERNPTYAIKRVKYLKRKQTGSAKHPPTPDPPPFKNIEAVILVAIAQLFKKYRRQYGQARLVEDYIANNPDFYQNIEELQ